MKVWYREDLSDGRTWWCEVHNRRATHVLQREWGEFGVDLARCCDPRLGGIMLPCSVYPMTEREVEFWRTG